MLATFSRKRKIIEGNNRQIEGKLKASSNKNRQVIPSILESAAQIEFGTSSYPPVLQVLNTPDINSGYSIQAYS